MRVFLLLLFFFPQTLLAHALYVVAQQQGTHLQGDTYYSDMTPAAEHYVAVFKENDLNTPAIEAMSDKKGHISLTLPDDKNYVLVVEGAEGHKATLHVPKLASDHTAKTASYDEFIQLRKDISQLEHKIFLRDILGGIGYIFGLVGLLLWFRQRKQ
ncbi:carboxypeptidase regulatory-like domain-containing protein [Pasteurella sp. PK-2025]|uniref:carboxypeptidase regulatory-like domain-containing protein n=1 Tax=unclassified Pasteurella TaxID=2621516 RepID=UPI003C78EB02